MRAIILAGGKGVRLAPVTDVLPKPLVPIGGMPIMEIVIRQLKKHGFSHITLAVGYLADLIKTYFQDGSKWGVTIDYSMEEYPLGTAGPLALVDNLDETFLVMNADVLTSINYETVIQFHREKGGIATVGAYQKEVKIDLGVIVSDNGYAIKDYIEKPVTKYLVSMGIYVFEPEILGMIKKGSYLDFPDLVKMLLAAGETVNYYPFTGYWMDIGRYDDYSQAVQEFDAMRTSLLVNDY